MDDKERQAHQIAKAFDVPPWVAGIGPVPRWRRILRKLRRRHDGPHHLAHTTPLADSAPHSGYPRAGQGPDGEWEWCYEDDGPDGPPRTAQRDGRDAGQESGDL